MWQVYKHRNDCYYVWAFLLGVRRDLVFKQTLVNFFELVNTIFQIYVLNLKPTTSRRDM